MTRLEAALVIFFVASAVFFIGAGAYAVWTGDYRTPPFGATSN